ncbi:hypothetical protein ACF0H5_003902 [Mactra antiquata]
MKAPIELYRPTILNIIAIVSYCLATMFHIIAYATDNWASIQLDDVRWRLGLWQGCREEDEYCTTEVFEHAIFQTGSDWHTGARVMMTLTLIILFFLEFTLIGYACVKNLEKFRGQLVGITIALSLSAAFCHFLVVIMYGTEVDKIPESSVKASYGIIFISIIIEVLIPLVIYIDKSRKFPSGGIFKGPRKLLGIDDPREGEAQPKPKSSRPNVVRRDRDVFTIDSTVSMRTSTTSLSEAETFKKYAYDDVQDASVISTGSANSINTRSTMFTNISGPDRASTGSLV